MNLMAAFLSLSYTVSCIAFALAGHYILAASMALWAVLFMAFYVHDRKEQP